jgi:hypothetical protein
MEGYLEDQQGRLVPLEMVKPIDRARSDLVMEIVGERLSLAKVLKDFRDHAMADVKAFVEISAEQYGAKIGGQKGNLTLTSFDGKYQVVVAVADCITFDERLQAAKSLVDECLKTWTDGARPELKAIVDNAFAVDKAGKINTGRVFALRRLDIDDPKWKRAMEAISDSVTIHSTKEYIRIYERNEKGDYIRVNLDIAS